MAFNVSIINNVLHAMGDNITIQHTILKIRPQLKSQQHHRFTYPLQDP